MPYKDPEKRKACKKAWYEANREKAVISNRTWRAANPEKVKASSKVYYEANSERTNAKRKAYREANPEKEKASQKAYSANPLNAALRSINKLTGLKKAEIPTELLETQALIISINREIRNHEKLHRA